MSEKRKAQRARHEAQEKEKAGKVVKWVFAFIILLAILFVAYGIYIGS